MAPEDIAKQLKAALEECARLREENKSLRSMLGIHEEKPITPMAEGLSQEDKVTLFRSLFHGIFRPPGEFELAAFNLLTWGYFDSDRNTSGETILSLFNPEGFSFLGEISRRSLSRVKR